MVRESMEPGQSVLAVARRNGISANQPFLWRKLYQEGSLSAVSAGEASKRPQRPVQFEITAQTRLAVEEWIKQARLRSEDFLFLSRLKASEHLSTPRYARIVKAWVASIGLDTVPYGTHPMHRNKASLIYLREKASEQYQYFWPHHVVKHYQILGIFTEKPAGQFNVVRTGK